MSARVASSVAGSREPLRCDAGGRQRFTSLAKLGRVRLLVAQFPVEPQTLCNFLQLAKSLGGRTLRGTSEK